MSRLGDDLIRSLKEAVDHAKSEGSGTAHAPRNPRDPKSGETDATADTDEARETADQ